MHTNTERWADEVTDSLEALRTMRDEVKVQIHLLGMEAKQRFEALEQRLDGDQLTARKNLHELAKSLRLLKDELAKATRPHEPLPPR